jgi:hypothetical protein
LKTDLNVVTLLVFGCSLPAVVMAFKINERTLADWLDKAGELARRVQEQLVCVRDSLVWARDGFTTWKGQTLRFSVKETQGKRGTVTTAFMERPKATLRTWLPVLTHRETAPVSGAPTPERCSGPHPRCPVVLHKHDAQGGSTGGTAKIRKRVGWDDRCWGQLFQCFPGAST